MKNIKEKVLMCCMSFKQRRQSLNKAVDLTLAEVGKVIKDIEVDIDDGFHPIEKYCNSQELKQKLNIK